MLNRDDKDRIAEEIAKLFDGLEVGDVAEIMTIQLAMLAAQGAPDLDEALEFLDEIRDDAADVLEKVDFGAADDDTAEPNGPDDPT